VHLRALEYLGTFPWYKTDALGTAGGERVVPSLKVKHGQNSWTHFRTARVATQTKAYGIKCDHSEEKKTLRNYN